MPFTLTYSRLIGIGLWTVTRKQILELSVIIICVIELKCVLERGFSGDNRSDIVCTIINTPSQNSETNEIELLNSRQGKFLV